jgi:DNA adenine methylase
MNLTPPLKFHGGKRYMAEDIIALMPPHLVYCEPYFGSGQVLFRRDPKDQRLWWTGRTSDDRKPDGVAEVANDLNKNVMNLYRVLRDPESFTRLQQALELTLQNEAEWQFAKELLQGTQGDEIERARALVVLCRQSLGGRMKAYTPPTKTRLRGGREDSVNSWWRAIEGLPAIHERLRDVKLLCQPALDVIRQLDLLSTLFYLDPPYYGRTRTAPNVYEHELSDADHEELLATIVQCKGKFMLSGYANELYDRVLHDWNRQVKELANHAAGGQSKRRMTEVLWYNF